MRDPTPESDHVRDTSEHTIPAAEWATAAAGAAVVLIALASLLYRAIWTVESPPKITITVLGIEPQQAGYLVRTRVFNSGTTTAAQVVIEGALKLGPGREERSQTTLDYVPAGSKRNAGLIFSSDPGEGELQVRPLGYQDP